jgi:hypothetical protein
MPTLSEIIFFRNREQEKIYTYSGIPDLKSRYCFDTGESQESVSLCDLKGNKRLITALYFDEISLPESENPKSSSNSSISITYKVNKNKIFTCDLPEYYIKKNIIPFLLIKYSDTEYNFLSNNQNYLLNINGNVFNILYYKMLIKNEYVLIIPFMITNNVKDISKNKYKESSIYFQKQQFSIYLKAIIVDNKKIEIKPNFLISKRKYPIQVYLYAIIMYITNNEYSQREVAKETKIYFKLHTFSHSTLCRALQRVCINLLNQNNDNLGNISINTTCKINDKKKLIAKKKYRYIYNNLFVYFNNHKITIDNDYILKNILYAYKCSLYCINKLINK